MFGKIFKPKKRAVENPTSMPYKYNPGDRIYGCMKISCYVDARIEAKIVPFTIEKVLIDHGTVRYVVEQDSEGSQLLCYAIPEILVDANKATLRNRIQQCFTLTAFKEA